MGETKPKEPPDPLKIVISESLWESVNFHWFSETLADSYLEWRLSIDKSLIFLTEIAWSDKFLWKKK